jgi:hypothetical protein
MEDAKRTTIVFKTCTTMHDDGTVTTDTKSDVTVVPVPDYDPNLWLEVSE